MTRRFFLWAGAISCVFGAVGTARAEAGLPPMPQGHEGGDSAESCSIDEHDTLARGLYSSDSAPRGEVTLTFDDGPHPSATPKVLDLLKKHGLVATFFVVGRSINQNTYPLIQRMVAEGHSIGTHTYNHDIDMATHRGDDTVEYITGQYAIAQLCVEIALLASSPEHFLELYAAVFERKEGRHLTSNAIRTQYRRFQDNHRALLESLGFAKNQRVYPWLFARPPGGIPYLGKWADSELRAQHETALENLGLINVLWHGGSGDTDKERARDFGFLVGNLRYHSRRGGILLIHDMIRKDALDVALERMARDPAIRVVPLQQAVERKFACGSGALRMALAPTT